MRLLSLCLVAVATGCVTTRTDRRLDELERELVGLRQSIAAPAPSPQLGGDEPHSAPIASLGTWVPAATVSKTLLGNMPGSPFGGIPGGVVTLTGTQTLSNKTFSNAITITNQSGNPVMNLSANDYISWASGNGRVYYGNDNKIHLSAGGGAVADGWYNNNAGAPNDFISIRTASGSSIGSRIAANPDYGAGDIILSIGDNLATAYSEKFTFDALGTLLSKAASGAVGFGLTNTGARLHLGSTDRYFSDDGSSAINVSAAFGANSFSSSGVFLSFAGSGSQAFACNSAGCRITMGSADRYFSDTGSELQATGAMKFVNEIFATTIRPSTTGASFDFRGDVPADATYAGVRVGNITAMTSVDGAVMNFFNDNLTTNVARITKDGAIVPNITGGGSRPACALAYRNWIWVTQGGAGVTDGAAICRKDAADAYAWTALY